MGIATLRAGALPRWSGLLLIVFWPVALALGDNGGGILAGLIWLALGYALRSQARSARFAPPPAEFAPRA